MYKLFVLTRVNVPTAPPNSIFGFLLTFEAFLCRVWYLNVCHDICHLCVKGFFISLIFNGDIGILLILISARPRQGVPGPRQGARPHRVFSSSPRHLNSELPLISIGHFYPHRAMTLNCEYCS